MKFSAALIFYLLCRVSCMKLTPVDFGVYHYEDGIVITNLPVLPKIVTLILPKYAEELPIAFSNLSMPSEMNETMQQFAERIGSKVDRHTRSSLTLWHQERSNKPVTFEEIQMYYNERTPKTKIKKRFIDVTGMGVYASVVSTAAMGLAINNKVEVQNVKRELGSMKDYAQNTKKTLDEANSKLLINSENIESLMKKANELENYSQSVLEVSMLLSDISVGVSIFESTLDEELEHLRTGRLPTKLLTKDILNDIAQKTTNKDLSMPLRLIKATVIDINPDDLKITIQVEVPMMEFLQYYQKFKVENVGVRDRDECIRLRSTPKYVVPLPQGFRSIAEEFCSNPSPSLMKCSLDSFNTTTSKCWPPSDMCEYTKLCGYQPIIIHTPDGYLLNFRREIVIRDGKAIIAQLSDNKMAYLIKLEGAETMTVDGSTVTSETSGAISRMDFSILAQNVSRTMTDYSENIRRMNEAQERLNKSLVVLANHPVMTGNINEWVQSLDTWMIVSGSVGGTTFFFVIILVVAYFWAKHNRHRAPQCVEKGFPYQVTTRPTAPQFTEVTSADFRRFDF